MPQKAAGARLLEIGPFSAAPVGGCLCLLEWLSLGRFDFAQRFDRLRNMNEKAAVAALAALAQEARLRVFRALVGAGPAGMTPTALSAMLDIPASTLSFHLKELVHADLVSAEREGRNLHYRPALKRMNDLLAYLTAHCCQGQPCAPADAIRRTTC